MRQIDYGSLIEDKIQATITFFRARLDYYLGQIPQNAQQIIENHGNLEAVAAQEAQAEETKKKITNVATEAGKIVDNTAKVESVSETFGAVAELATHFYFLYQKKKTKENLRRAQKLVACLEKWGGITKIKQPIGEYLSERFKYLLMELADTQQRNQDIKILVDFFSTAVVIMMENNEPPEDSPSRNINSNYLDKYLFPVGLSKNKPLLIVNLFQKKLNYKLSGNHPWSCEGIVYRSSVCTSEGIWLTQQGEDDQLRKYPLQRLSLEIARQHGFVSARLNLKGRAIKEGKLLLPSLNKTEQELQKILEEIKDKIKSQIINLPLSNANISSPALREVRATLFNILKKNKLNEKIISLYEYCSDLLPHLFQQYVEHGSIPDHIETLSLWNEIDWLEQLLKEVRASDLRNVSKKDQEKIQQTDDALNLLYLVKDYCRVSSEINFGCFFKQTSYDPIIAPEKSSWQKLKVSLFRQPQAPNSEFQNAVRLYNKMETNEEVAQSIIDILTKVIESFGENPNPDSESKTLLIQSLLLRALTYQKQLLNNPEALSRFECIINDARAVLKVDQTCQEAHFLIAAAFLGLKQVDEAEKAVKNYRLMYPHDQKLKDLQMQYNKLNKENQLTSHVPVL